MYQNVNYCEVNLKKPHLTDGVRNTLRGSARIGCGKRDLQVVDASSADRPSHNPMFPYHHQDYKRRWDLHVEKKLKLVE